MTLDSRVGRFATALSVAGTLFFGGLGLASKGACLNAQPTKQEEKQKKEIGRFKHMKEESDCQEKKPSSKTHQSKVNQYSLKPVNFDVLYEDGTIFNTYRNVSYDHAKAGLVIEIPERGRLFLVGAESQEKDGFVLDFIVNNAYSQKVSDLSGRSAFEEINTRALRLRAGDKGSFSLNLERGLEIASSMRFGYEIIPVEEQESQPVEKPKPKPPVDVLRGQLLSVEEVARIHKQRQKTTSGVIIPQIGVFINAENTEVAQEDPQRTGTGSIIQLQYAKPNIRLWFTNFHRVSDDQILAAGSRVLNHTFNETSLGFETKLGKGDLGFLFGLEGNLSNSQYEPDRTPIWTPRTEKTTFYSGNVRGGLMFGEFDKSFFEASGFFGYGKFNVLSERPGSYDVNYLLGSEWFKQTGYMLQGRLISGPFLLEGTYTNENNTGKTSGVDRKITTLNGTAQISMGVLSDSLKNLYLGVLVHQFDSKDSNMKASHTYFAPVATLRLPLK